MTEQVTINLRHVARGLGIPLRQIQAVVELLDEGNTVPFITRYRKDRTGGLDEEAVRQIQGRLVKLRLLAERKQTILRSIEAQGKLTEELAKQILDAGTTKRLEDLYLPFKPKKQTLATLARSRGLELLAAEILSAAPSCSDLDGRVADFVNPDRQVPTPADALLGAGHILAEQFSEKAELRQRLRDILQRTGKLVSTRFVAEGSPSAGSPSREPGAAGRPPAPKAKEVPDAGLAAAASEVGCDPSLADVVDTVAETDVVAEADMLVKADTFEAADTFDVANMIHVAETVEMAEPVEPAESVDSLGSVDVVSAADAVAPIHEACEAGTTSQEQAEERREEQAEEEEEEEEEEGEGEEQQQQQQQEIGVERTGEPNPRQADNAADGAAPAEAASEAQPPGEAVSQSAASGLDEPPAQTPSEPSGQPIAPLGLQAAEPVEASAEPVEASAEQAAGPGSAVAEAGAACSDPAATSTEPAMAPGEIAAVVPEPGAATSEQAAAASADPAAAVSPSAKPTSREARAAKQAKIRQKQAKKDIKKKKAEERKQRAFSDYFDYAEEIRKIPPHRILAINRGERAKMIRVRMEYDMEAMCQALEELCVPAGHPHADLLRGCARDALTRLILPSLDREIRRELTERAEAHAVSVFARNLRNLLLQPPVRDRRILAIDPGYKSGCKLVALDQFGSLLDHGIFYLIGKPERKLEARQTILALIDKHQLTVVAIGNGTGCRETEDLVAEMIGNELKDKGVSYVIVNEAGASVYSTSRVGREELPGHDATLRSAISIGRRLQDPLSELVKIDPASIGVGLYQHDVKAKHLRASLDEVVESCVNFVGVDVNTASPALLRYVSGLNQLTARRLYEHRLQHGPFASREQLKEVPGFGEVTFVQAAGFLKIAGGGNPLDATWIHPESYEIAGRVMAKLNCTAADLAAKEAGQPTTGQLPRPDATALAAELQVGTLLLKDILAQLSRPGRDPREDLPPPVFKRGILKLEDLTAGMELTGTVLNVVDFGAFVDIGMHDSGLVHVSHMADRFIRDPHEVVAVGDIVRVWVLDVDKQRRRVSLTMIRPGSPRGGHRGRPETAQGDSADAADAAAPQKPREQGRPRPPQGAPRARPQGQGQRQGQGRPPMRTQGPPPRAPFKPRSQPKPVVPLTEDMKSGKAPLRTFGDLLQFYDLKQQGGSKPPANKPPASKPLENKPLENKPLENKPLENKPLENKPPENRAADNQAPEDPLAGAVPLEGHQPNDAPDQPPEVNPESGTI